MNQLHSSQIDTNVVSDKVSDSVKEALRISLRGCDELLPQADWLKKLVKSEATKTPLRIKLGLDPTTYYRGCWHVVSRCLFLRYRH